MKQITFSDVEYSKRRRITKREEFLDTMDTIIPWTTWIAMIAPYYPEGKRGRRPIEIEVKLRMYLLQVEVVIPRIIRDHQRLRHDHPIIAP